MDTPVVELIRPSLEDLSLAPPRFAVDGIGVPCLASYVWTTFRDDPELPPVHYLRSCTDDLLRSGGIIRQGDAVSSPHTVLPCSGRLKPNGTPLTFGIVEGDPEGHTDDAYTYEWRASDSDVLFRFSSRYFVVRESDVLELTAEYLPTALVANSRSMLGAPYLQQMVSISGRYLGKEFEALGAFDRVYGKSVMQSSYGKLYRGMAFAGIRPDGRREWGSVMLFGNEGFGYFCRDGEESIATTDVEVLHADWEALGYLGDGTVALKSAVFRVGDREIHYEGQHGYRGWDEDSILSLKKSGYSMSSGMWHEGSAPYEFAQTFSFAESHDAFQTSV